MNNYHVNIMLSLLIGLSVSVYLLHLADCGILIDILCNVIYFLASISNIIVSAVHMLFQLFQ